MAALLCVAVAGCGLLKLRGETRAMPSYTVLVGRVSSAVPWDKPVVVAAYAMHKGRVEIAHRVLLHEIGAYELIVPRGAYLIFAFGDANGNLRYDEGEPTGVHAGGTPVAAAGEGVITFLDVSIAREERGTMPVGTSFAPSDGGVLRSTQAGAIARLEDAAFSEPMGKRGYWSPLEFFREMGGNIYFLEPYDPAKTPVLFVHGAAGTPRDFEFLAAGIDRSRYQPWFFFYPSGATVKTMAQLLFWKLQNLQARYGFRRLHVVAHSMGGLVVREFLAERGAEFPYVKVFVSLSTPWGGDTFAAYGVRQSPAVIPSWNDLVPEGALLRTLFDKPLPAGTEYYLFFGHRGRGTLLFLPPSDGTISVESQLAAAAQAQARMSYGFNETHEGILVAQPVLAQLATLLASADEPPESPLREGRLSVLYTYDTPANVPRAPPLLVLTPVDSRAARVTLTLEPEGSGRVLGPFPAGAYDVSLIAYAFRTEPSRIPLTIGDRKTTRLGFRLVPQGVLTGYVTRAAATLAPGTVPAPLDTVKIESITLTGPGVRRALVPDGDDDLTAPRYIEGADHAGRSTFSFVGLPEGEYELSIRAQGFQPYVGRHRVLPGAYGSFKPVTLSPLK
ncbi:MAG TPA: alpha/beta hydrolase [Burkholderiales bacterium]